MDTTTISENINLALVKVKIFLVSLFQNVGSALSNTWVYVKPLFSNFFDTFGQKTITLYQVIAQHNFFLQILGVVITISTINWAIWLMRRARSTFYKPYKEVYQASTSVVIPVYQEKKYTLKDTIDSILKNNPDEIIIIFDQTEKKLMSFVRENYKHVRKIKTHFIDVPGKRPALAKGIELAQHEIVVLVDSDTQWKTSHFLENLIKPFRNPKVGATGSRQKVKFKDTWVQKIIDWNLDLKYSDYIPSDSISGSVLCLSGRTAAYRRDIIVPVLDKLVNEYFLGHHCVGGDDTRLTTLVLQQGYKAIYQDNAVAETEFHPSIWPFLKQKTRWSRNSFRAYLRAIFSAWPWKQRRWQYLISAYYTLVPGISALVGVAFFSYAIYYREYSFIYFWIAWLFISRLIKGYSHLKKHPEHLYLWPTEVLYFFILSFIKLYAFFTLTWESWAGSRGDYKIVKGKRVATKAAKSPA